MRITAHDLRLLIEQAVHESVTGEKMHRCFNGSLVPHGSQACLDDLGSRIEDSMAIRDECDCRTDKREHYNGILKVLRRELRGAQKAFNLTQDTIPERDLDDDYFEGM